MDRVTSAQLVELVKGLVMPFLSLNQILCKTYPQNQKTNSILVMLYAVSYLGWWACYMASGSYPGLKGAAWTLFIVAGGLLGALRSGFRSVHDLRSNIFADYVSVLFLWPHVLAQMCLQNTTTATRNEKRVKELEKEGVFEC
jgi:hypothetical protein